MAGEFQVKSGNVISSIVRSLKSGHGLVRSGLVMSDQVNVR